MKQTLEKMQWPANEERHYARLKSPPAGCHSNSNGVTAKKAGSPHRDGENWEEEWADP